MALSPTHTLSASDWTAVQTEAFLSLADELSASLVSIIGCAAVLRNRPDHWGAQETGSFLDTIVTNAEHSVRILENAKILLSSEPDDASPEQPSPNLRGAPQPGANQSPHQTRRSSPVSPVGKVLIVETDHRLSYLLKTRFERVGHTVICTAETNHAPEIAAVVVPDIILLELPDNDCSCHIDLCRELRELTPAPIIVIASRFDEDDLVESLHSGADDYVAKPLQVNELMARVQAQLRRAHFPGVISPSRNNTVFKTGDLTINFAQRQVNLRGEPVELTPVEYKLLYNLAANAGRFLTHEQLISKIWGPMFNQESQYLWVNVSRLRAKIEDDPGDPQYIVTKRGVGYSLAVFDPPSDYD
jgi:two-component system KDP operon response regulator KdpE